MEQQSSNTNANVQHLPVLDIRKVTAAMLEALIMQRDADAKQQQPLCDSMDVLKGKSEQELHAMAVRMAPVEMQHFIKLMESSPLIEKALHDTTHAMFRHIEKHPDHQCNIVIGCLAQSIIMGWQLACAYLETQALDKSMQ